MESTYIVVLIFPPFLIVVVFWHYFPFPTSCFSLLPEICFWGWVGNQRTLLDCVESVQKSSNMFTEIGPGLFFSHTNMFVCQLAMQTVLNQRWCVVYIHNQLCKQVSVCKTVNHAEAACSCREWMWPAATTSRVRFETRISDKSPKLLQRFWQTQANISKYASEH